MWNVAMFSLIVAIFSNRCLESKFFACVSVVKDKLLVFVRPVEYNKNIFTFYVCVYYVIKVILWNL